MTDEQRIEMIEDQLELMESVCASYVEGDELQDVGNIRAIYEEYGEWFDSWNKTGNSETCYVTMWAPNFLRN